MYDQNDYENWLIILIREHNTGVTQHFNPKWLTTRHKEKIVNYTFPHLKFETHFAQIEKKEVKSYGMRKISLHLLWHFKLPDVL